MRHPAALALLLLLASPAAADPPAVLAIASSWTPGASAEKLERLADGKAPLVLIDPMPSGSYGLAVNEASGRWAMTFTQLSNGDPLKIGGKAVSKPGDRNTLVLGDASGATASTFGDPSCTNRKTACFETPIAVTADGKYVFVRSESSRAAVLSRWTFGARPTRAAITDGKIGGMHLPAGGGTHAAYVGDDGVHVIDWPAQKPTATKVTASRQAVAKPDLLQSDAWPIGERLYWFRREPKEQKRGYFEAFDLATKQTVTLHEAAKDFPMFHGAFLSTGPRGTVVFADDQGGDRSDVLEAPADGARPATAVAHDVRRLLDVSADGRYVLVARWKDPAKGEQGDNFEQLVIVDLTTDHEVATLDPGGPGTEITAAAFVGAP